jgi:hypothetical protein
MRVFFPTFYVEVRRIEELGFCGGIWVKLGLRGAVIHPVDTVFYWKNFPVI